MMLSIPAGVRIYLALGKDPFLCFGGRYVAAPS